MDSQGRTWVTHHTLGGGWYRLFEKPMPRIADQIVDCSIYLYASETEARSGAKSGGSGFLAHVRSATNKQYLRLYAVTNKHILDQGCVVLRLTKVEGGIDTIVTKRQDWVPHPNGYDVQVLPIDLSETLKWWSVGSELFITPRIIESYRIGLGDEAFLVGRLVTHAGVQKNAPIVRFGNVSLMNDPSEPIEWQGHSQESFLVECRSLSGFSGSPVFIMTTQTYHGADAQRIVDDRRAQIELEGVDLGVPQDGISVNAVSISVTNAGPWLLGIDCGHIPLWRPVFESDLRTKTEQSLMVEANTGVACVLPAWHVLEALNDEDLVKQRRREDLKLAKRPAI